MIIQTVLVFAFLSALFEFIVIMKLKPRTRCRVLGSSRWVATIHMLVITFNLFVHWGTLMGTMAAVISGMMSFATVPFARYISGVIINNVYYPGIKRYTIYELQ